MSQAEMTSEGCNDLSCVQFGEEKTDSIASYGKKWKLKNQRLSFSTMDTSTGRLQASTADMSGRSRFSSTLDKSLGLEHIIDMPQHPSALMTEAMQDFSDIVGELPIEVALYETKMKAKLKNRRIPVVPEKDVVPAWMLDQGGMNVPDPEAPAIMEMLDEACTLFLCLPQLQALQMDHTSKQPAAVRSWGNKRSGMNMPNMRETPRLTADVLARFDACHSEGVTVPVPCWEPNTKNKLKNQSLMAPQN